MSSDTRGAARIPGATYRLQFNNAFGFKDATAVVDYLAALGVSDCYASSYLKAVPGSGHGYDVVDPTRLNPEVGSDEAYAAWIEALRSHGMGHILDIVPNHMGIAQSANPWWNDVLENGASSRYARFFDIEWHPVKDELANKVLIPILGDQYGAALERQELRLEYSDGAFGVSYFDNWLPIAPDTYGQILTPGIDAWLTEHAEVITLTDADELRSILTAAANLPLRTAQDPEAIALRTREKEVLKRRLAAVLERSESLRRFVDQAITTLNGIHGQVRSFDALDRLLDAQSYRLAHWRVASEEINYRRFFDVNQLAALRMEDPEVFEEVHRFAFDLIDRGAATGLRIDHVDGLYAPGDYLNRLQSRAASPLYVVVEKILGPDEELPDWPVNGTTGYEFAATVNNLFVDGRNQRAFDDIYWRFVRGRDDRLSFDDLAYLSKKLVMHETMSGDINSLGHQLNRFSERNRHFRDFTLYSLISMLKEVIACFPVYRTYITERGPVTDHDRRYVTRAIRAARRRVPGVSAVVLDFIERVLLKQTPVDNPAECEERARFIGKFQQITSPVAAKGIEDTSLYIYNRLLSLNEVGSDPTRFGLEPDAVHRWLAARQARYPSGLSSTSTHDTKRGEDSRARLNVLSEMPGAWKSAVSKWRRLNRRLKADVAGLTTPDANEEYFLYQTLIGAWPMDGRTDDHFHDRLHAYILKALREAKVRTTWLSPNEAYERGVLHFAEALLDPRRPFRAAFEPFQRLVADYGITNSLSQLTIKMTAPGVPDFYQGTELWDLSFVDPDNRSRVDYDRRRALLDAIATERRPAGDLARELLQERRDGRLKLHVMARGLRERAARAALFRDGAYTALDVTGERRESAFAFARHVDGEIAVTLVPRLVTALTSDGTPPVGRGVWQGTRIDLTAFGAPRMLYNVFTNGEVAPSLDDGRWFVDAAVALADLPVAILAAAPQAAVR